MAFASASVRASCRAFAISFMNVALLLDKLDTHGSEDFKIDKDKEFHGQWETLMKAREEYYKSASQVLLKDL